MKRIVWLCVFCIVILGGHLSAGSIEEVQALLQIGRWEKAVEAFRSLPPEVGDGVDALCGLAGAYRGLGAYDKALDVSRAAVAAASEDIDLARAEFELGQSLLGRRKKKFYPEAAEAFRRAAELNCERAVSRLLLAETLLYQKEPEAARPILEELKTTICLTRMALS